jgi:pimeloyl-ACP methyl ester carboxylesterase
VKKIYLFLPIVAMLATGGCAYGKESIPSLNGECVVLLHGLMRSSAAMEPMAQALQESGFRVANVDYASRDYPIEYLAPMAVGSGIEECESYGDVSAIHFVTHSLGGILVRYYFAHNDLDNLGRVVMLAPPNQGSNAADALRDLPGYEWLSGPIGYQLGKGEDSVPLSLGPPDFDFAVVAGDRTIDPITSSVLENPDDGKVSVSDTYLEGMRDFRVVGASHTFIMQKKEVFQLVKNYLDHGSFDDS